MDERRMHKRERVSVPIIYSYYKNDSKRVDTGNKAIDISGGGISFSENSCIPIGSNLMIKINLINKIVNCQGTVVWNKEEQRDKWSIGVQFKSVSAIDCDIISAASKSVFARMQS